MPEIIEAVYVSPRKIGNSIMLMTDAPDFRPHDLWLSPEVFARLGEPSQLKVTIAAHSV